MSEALKTTHWCIYSEKAIKIIEFRNGVTKRRWSFFGSSLYLLVTSWLSGDSFALFLPLRDQKKLALV